MMHRTSHARRFLLISLVILCGIGGIGCRKRSQAAISMLEISGPAVVVEAPGADTVRELPMFDGHSGAALGWSDVLNAIDRADIVILGELHDDAIGHAAQLAIVADAFARSPRGALTLEMLERDEQDVLDDYTDGLIDAKTLAKLTHSENWGEKGKWHEFYQPIIDAAMRRSARVIAANAPRRYVRIAHLEGYRRLEALPPARRELFDLPRANSESSYRDRFFGLFSHPSESASEAEVDTDEPPTVEETPDEKQPTASAHAGGRPLTPDEIESMFRSQLVWDATMAQSIAHAHRSGAKKVIHLVGQFHSDFQGGLVQELRQRTRRAEILTLSLQPAWPGALRDADRGRADVVIYTGDREEPETDESDDATENAAEANP